MSDFNPTDRAVSKMGTALFLCPAAKDKRNMKNFDKEIIKDAGCALGSFLLMLFLLVCLCAIAGCSPRTVYVPAESVTVHTDTDSLTRYVRELIARSSLEREKETVYIHQKESTNVTTNERGDTVRTDTRKETFVGHDKELGRENRLLTERNDSLVSVIAKKDSMLKTKPVVVEKRVEKRVEVPRERAWWETALLWCGAIALAVCGWMIWRRLKG